MERIYFMNIYNCPCCGEKTFSPIKKAFAGQMNSKGKRCSACGKRCVNGKGATIFNAIFSLAAIICMIVIFLTAPKFYFLARYEVVIQAGIVLAIIFVPKLVNAFFFRMTEAIRLDF